MKKFGLILVSLVLSANLHANGISRKDTCEELMRNQWLNQTVMLNINQIGNFPGNWAMASQQIMHNLITHFKNPNLDFAYFEQYFRAHNVPLFLVANSQPIGAGLRVGYSKEMGELKGGPAKYHLWVGVNGQAEADALKASLGISDEENLLRLRETGFIVVDDLQSAKSNPALHVADDQTIDAISQTRVRRPFNPEDN